ncbi:hypothetical protein [uncultured Sphingomonas sp.]|uniref:hypothetical protein n=1 Tax=uncultured Sphingomonas sp. TaxID=158754 RepID=UPI0030F55C68
MVTEFDIALLARRTNEATRGDSDAAYDLGVAYSTGTVGATLDLIEAHKWFNLAAAWGNDAAAAARSEIAEDMTAREISNAQRAARDVLGGMQRRAA